MKGKRREPKGKNIVEIKSRLIEVLKRNGVKKAALFGSIARGEAKEKSDIDLIVEFSGRKSLLDLVGLKMEAEHALGRKVDVITYNSIHPLLKDRILNEQIPIL